MGAKLTGRPYDPTAAAELQEALKGDTAEAVGFPTAVPVIVTDAIRTAPEAPHSFTVRQINAPADGSPVEVGSAHAMRVRLVVVNNDAAKPLFLAQLPQLATPTAGFKLAPGASLEVKARGELFAASDGTAAVVLSVLAEFTDGG